MTETTTSSQANDPIEVWLALSTNCVILNPLAYTRDVSGEHGSIMTIFHKNISAFPSIKYCLCWVTRDRYKFPFGTKILKRKKYKYISISMTFHTGNIAKLYGTYF